MENVGGLRPQNSGRPQVRQKDGRAGVQRDTSQRVGLSPSASPVSTYVRPEDPQADLKTAQLAEALSELSPALGNFNKQRLANKENDQMQKLRYYTEQFRKDREAGAVNEAQVKSVFPELVPTVAARVAQATGQLDAKQWLEGEIQGILQDDSIRLDSAARGQAIEQIKAKAREQIGTNEFYGTGFLEQMDRSLGEFETAWMRETAKYHEDIQAEAFSTSVAETLRSGGSLEDLDAQWKQSSSLNNQERNRLVLDTVTAQAIAANDPRILDQIPDRFMNAETKAGIARTKQQIETSVYSQFVRSKEFTEWERDMGIRNGKTDILGRLVSGEGVNPAEFHHTPELYEYAVRMNAQPSMDNTTSIRNAQSFKSNLSRAGTTGSYTSAFSNDPQFVGQFRSDESVNEESLRDHILARTDINPSEKQSLLEEIPLLMEGVNFYRDPDVTTSFTVAVGDDLKVFAGGIQGGLLQQAGVNVQGSVQDTYYNEVRLGVNAYVEENNAMPKGEAKRRIIREAAEAAKARLKYYQDNYRQEVKEGFGSLSGKPTPSPSRDQGNNTAPSAKQSSDDGFIVLPNGTRVRKIE